MKKTACLRPWFAAESSVSTFRKRAVGALFVLGVAGAVACAPEEPVAEDASEVTGSSAGRLGDDWRLVVQDLGEQYCLVREPDEVVKFSRCYARVEETWQIQETAPRSGGVVHQERVGWLWKVLEGTVDGSTKLLATVELEPGKTPKLGFLPASKIGELDEMREEAFRRGAILSPVQSFKDADGNWKVPEVAARGGARYKLSFVNVGEALPDGALELAGAKTRETDARLVLVPIDRESKIALERIGSNTCDATRSCGDGKVCRWEGAEQCLSQCGIAAGPYLWACMEACNRPGEAFVVEEEGNGFSFRYTLQRSGFCGTPNSFEKFQQRCLDGDENVVACSGSQLFAAGFSCGTHEELFRCDEGFTCRGYVERKPGESISVLKTKLCVPKAHLVRDISREDCLAHPTHCLEEHDGISLCWRSGGWSTTGKRCDNGKWVSVSWYHI